MTRDLPSLEAPEPGAACEGCGRELRIVGFCAACFEDSMQEQERLVAQQMKQARQRARAWQLGRGVSQ